MEHRFLSGVIPWDGKRGKDQFGIFTDNFNISEFNNTPVWQVKPLQNSWFISDTTEMYFSERRGFSLNVQNGANSASMRLFNFNNTDTLDVGESNLPAFKVKCPLIINNNTILGNSAISQIYIGNSSRKHDLKINAFTDVALTMTGGQTNKTWAFESGNEFALRYVTG